MKMERVGAHLPGVCNFGFIALLVLTLATVKLEAADFHTGRVVPVFDRTEQQVLDEFGIRFVRLKKVSQIELHNREVNKIIARYGNDWRDRLIGLTSSFGADKRNFIAHLFSKQALEHMDRKAGSGRRSTSISYHINGIIGVYEVRTSLRNDGGGMYHYRVRTKNWDASGRGIKGSSRIFHGSA